MTKKQRQNAEGKKKVVSSGVEEDDVVEKKVYLLTNLGGEAEDLQPREHGNEAQNQSGGGAEDESGGSKEEESEGTSEEDTDDGIELQSKEHIRKELRNMSFEDIMKLQQQVGTKVFNEVAYNRKKCQEVSNKKRLNKNRPMEMSAKKPPSFLRQVIPVKKSTRRDPRFDSLSGEYKPEIFEMTYKFINDLKHREKEIIKRQLKKTKNTSQRKERLQFLLRRLETQEQARQSQEQQRERELQFKNRQRERASRGERPFFLKKCKSKSSTRPPDPQDAVSCHSHILCFYTSFVTS
ncbi:hypothetical protein CRENBAI_022102 [Crenichthys baileyi]|uniref:rRNA biogenesis protein RRP36 n=1 Tax=Crenichthys baileyi TaxID=28760 RepID=A0AAV9SNP0_9TELE